MERRYVAIVDNGHERFRVDYYSTHRNGSKANKEDLKREWIRRGHSWNLTVVSTYLNNDEEGFWN